MSFFNRKSNYTKFTLRAKIFSYSIKEYSRGRYLSLTLYKGSKKKPSETFYLLSFNESVIDEVESLSKTKKGALNITCKFYVVSKLKGHRVENQLRVVEVVGRKKTGDEVDLEVGFGAINGFSNNKEFF